MVDIQTPLETFFNMSLTSSCFTDEAIFLIKAKLLVLVLLSLSARLLGFPKSMMAY